MENIHERAALNEMEDLIQTRKETIDRVVDLLVDINAISKDINQELQVQGDNLQTIQKDMENTKNNTEAGNEQLKQAVTKVASSNGCLAMTLGIVILLLIVLIWLGF